MALTIQELAAELRSASVRAPVAVNRVALAVAKLAAQRARSYIGHPQSGWPPLAASTVAERTRLGYSANAPLLRLGDFQGSIEAEAVGGVGIIGSNDPRAKWFEHGTRRMPARPVFSKAVIETAPALERAMAEIPIIMFTP